MKNKEKKIVRLLEEGFSYDTIKKMNNYHLNKIYKNIISEAVVRVPADKFGSIKDELSDTDTVEVTEDDAALDKMADLDPNEDPNPEGNEDGPSDNMNANDGMGIFEDIDEDAVVEELFGKPKMKTPITTLGMFEDEITEKSVSQSQQKLMGLALSVKRGETPKSEVSKKVLDMVNSMTEKELEDFASTKHKGLPKKKKTKKEKVRQIEESIVSLIKKSQGKMITKGDLLSEQPSTAPAPVRTPTEEPSPTRRKRRPTPNIKPKPKAGDRKDTMPDWFTLNSIMSVGDTKTAPAPVRTPTEEPSPTRRKRRPTPNIKPKPKARK